nr:MAG TPA: minor tail protein [Caudoviricetes sp.]
MADGYITIETKLSTNKFDKQVTDLEKKIKNEEEKAQLKLKAKLQAEDELEKHKQKIVEIEQEYEKTSQQVERLQNIMDKQGKGISLTPQDFTDLQNYAEINKQNEKLGATLDKAYEKQTKLNNKVEQTSLAYKQIQDNVQGYKTKIESVKLQKQQAQVDSIKKNFDGVGKSVSRAIGRVARLALGVISIASAYRFVSQASSTLGQYDEQYATNLEYIRYLIAQTIAPALKYVVNLASTLLSYLNYILNAWFGITLFSKNSAKNFMNAKNSTGGISKNTGKIKKDLQTTPFDEMNVLSDTSDSGTSGGAGGGAVAPSIDPSLFKGEVPDWLQWIVDHKDEILAVIAGVAAGLSAWQLGLSAIKGLGIGVMIAGIVYTIESLLDYLKDPSWENFGKIIQGIGIAIMGLGILIAQTPVIVAGAIILIVGTIIKYWEQIKAFLQSGIDWLKGKSDWVRDTFGDTIGDIYDYLVETLQHILDAFDSLFTMLKNILDDVIKIVKDIIHGDWKQAWEDAKQLVVDIFQGLWNTIKNIFFAIASLGASIATAVGGTISSIFKAIINAILSAIENILNKPIKTVNAMIGVVNAVPGVHVPTLPTFRLPRLAKGTILNAPGRGVPVAGRTALAGEAGREAYLPLSDTQLLEELGSTIGKYITINANITNTMNGRVISRQLQRIQNDSNFAYNS